MQLTSVYVERLGKRKQTRRAIFLADSTGRNASIGVHAYLGGPAGSGTLFTAAAANQASDAGIANACRLTSTDEAS